MLEIGLNSIWDFVNVLYEILQTYRMILLIFLREQYHKFNKAHVQYFLFQPSLAIPKKEKAGDWLLSDQVVPYKINFNFDVRDQCT